MEYKIKKKEKYYIKTYYIKNKTGDKDVKILDKDFIKKNKYKCRIIYKNKIYELKEYFSYIDINYNHKDLIRFKIIFIHNIIDMSYMFYNCDQLISLSNNNKANLNILNFQIYIINMSFMFYGCTSLLSLPDISKWNTFNVNEMNHIFYKCNSLRSLPDISKWNTFNVNDMNHMFYKCNSLRSLPDISKWNTSNVNDTNHMFYKCNSLRSLPDISTWNTSNIKDMHFMFGRCKPSLKFPFFYILDKDMNNIFFELTYQINEDDADYLRILNGEFIKKNKNKGSILYNNCEFKLKEYCRDINIDINNKKDIIKIILCLNKNIEDISYLFCGCAKLISIKKISIFDYYYKINNQSTKKKEENKYKSYNPKDNFFNINNNIYLNNYTHSYNDNVENELYISSESNSFQNNFPLSFFTLTNLCYLFHGCNSLKSLPDISKWDISNVYNMDGIFGYCYSLISLPNISEWNTSKVESMNNMFMNVIHYYHYLIFQNGIFQMLKI